MIFVIYRFVVSFIKLAFCLFFVIKLAFRLLFVIVFEIIYFYCFLSSILLFPGHNPQHRFKYRLIVHNDYSQF